VKPTYGFGCLASQATADASTGTASLIALPGEAHEI
jgi:hypothetical protein